MNTFIRWTLGIAAGSYGTFYLLHMAGQALAVNLGM